MIPSGTLWGEPILQHGKGAGRQAVKVFSVSRDRMLLEAAWLVDAISQTQDLVDGGEGRPWLLLFAARGTGRLSRGQDESYGDADSPPK